MIDPKDCWLKDNCKQLHCNDKNGCLILYKLNYLYNEANVPLKLRKNIPLRTDADGTDLEEFKLLKNIQDNISEFVADGGQLYIHSRQAGNGKAQPDDSLILTEKGYVKMKDIKIGDRIFGEDGKLHSVIGKFDQGYKDIYSITFNDRTTTESCDEHLWNISDRSSIDKSFKTVTLKSMLEKELRGRVGGGWRYQIPVTKPLVFEKKTFVLHPYILGYILGDGSTSQDGSINLTINEKDADSILPIINSLLPEDYYVKKAKSLGAKYAYSLTSDKLKFGRKPKDIQFSNILKDELKRYNIIKNKSPEKYIPDDYLFSDVDSRISLLQGLMDSDGTVLKNTNNVSFGSTSARLVEGFTFLVQSLGGTVTTSIKKNRAYNYKRKDGGEERRKALDFYYCQVKLPSNIMPFRLERKIKRFSNNQQNEPYRSIRDISYVGKKHSYCITTDNPSQLYLTNDCIVTHNSSWALRLLQTYFNKIWLRTDLRCRALFINVPLFLIKLKENISNKLEYITHIQKNVYDCDLVIWDDIGTKSSTVYEGENLLSIIDYRIGNGKANIFTSNLNDKELHEALGDRLASRICNSGINIEFRGGDKRGLDVGGDN